uniref:Uncharacterized protein n=1 Tax=Anguilla anguilla TaxID=7936 RepID=A0A0E9SYK9_ANGAN
MLSYLTVTIRYTTAKRIASVYLQCTCLLGSWPSFLCVRTCLSAHMGGLGSGVQEDYNLSLTASSNRPASLSLLE